MASDDLRDDVGQVCIDVAELACLNPDSGRTADRCHGAEQSISAHHRSRPMIGSSAADAESVVPNSHSRRVRSQPMPKRECLVAVEERFEPKQVRFAIPIV
jgi:hypothetical protein